MNNQPYINGRRRMSTTHKGRKLIKLPKKCSPMWFVTPWSSCNGSAVSNIDHKCENVKIECHPDLQSQAKRA